MDKSLMLGVWFGRLPWVMLLTLALLVPGSPTIAQEPAQEVPINAVGGTVHVDQFTGTAISRIPIAVPPGRGGVQPTLALVYHSINVYASANDASVNGWVGRGWTLDAGMIERQTKFGLDYTGDDYTLRLSDLKVDLVNVGTNTYRAKIEGEFTRVQKKTATDGQPYFVATDKTGTQFSFGPTAATRVADPSDAGKIFRWGLSRVEDPHGNYMTLSYTSDQGQAYLKQIDYTGHGSTAPTNQVLFHLEARPDAVPMYTTNFLIKTAKRLQTIEVKANGRRVRAYSLTYISSAGTSRSLLSQVQQVGKDAELNTAGAVVSGTSLPAITMSYQVEGTAFEDAFSGPAWSDSGGWSKPEYYATIAYPDLNGDGEVDLCARGSAGLWCQLWAGTWGDPKFGTAFKVADYTDTGGWTKPEYYTTIAYPDLNGDGRADLCARGSAGLWCQLETGTGTDPAFGTAFKVADYTDTGGWSKPEYYTTIAYPDLNGDGQADVCARDSAGLWCQLWTGTGFGTAFKVADYTDAAGWNKPEYYATIAYPDLNGDGRADVCARGSAGLWCQLGTGTGVGTASKVADYTDAAGWNKPEYYATIAYPDLNGDGRADVCARGSAGLWCQLGTGTGVGTAFKVADYTDAAGWNKPEYYATIAYPDLNGDGRADLCARGSAGLWCQLGTGSEFGTAFKVADLTDVAGWTKPEYYTTIAYQDFTGDGQVDLCARGSAGLSCREGPEISHFRPDTGPLNLRRITNAWHGTTSLQYIPSTQYSNTQLPYPVYTVFRIGTSDGNDAYSDDTIEYAYSGGYHHIGEREFRGFNYVKARGRGRFSAQRTITETWFHQGNDTAVDVNTPAVADGYLQGAPYRTKVTNHWSGSVYTEITTTYTADADGQAPFYTPPASVVTKTYDGNASARTTRTDFYYDAYGNVTEERQYGDTSTTADDRTVQHTYGLNTSQWLVGLPTSETIYGGLGTTGTQLAKTTFYYDGTSSCSVAATTQQPTKGKRTRTVRWLQGGTSPETRWAYDAYGNVTCTRDARGQTTTLGYDTTKTLVTSVTNPQGQVTTTAYYGVNGEGTDHGLDGQVKSVTDANGAVVTTHYDVLGRRVKVTHPDGFWTTTKYVSFGTLGQQHVQTESQLGLSTWTYVDGLGRVIKQQRTGPEDKLWRTYTEYDDQRNVARLSLPYDDTKQIDTAPAGQRYLRGLWSDGATLWVGDDSNDKLYAYDLATGARKPAEDFALAAAGLMYPYGLWSDGTTLWVADGYDDKLYAYDLATKARKPAEDFDTLKAAGNTYPTGIWSDETTLWVGDYYNKKLYAYDLATKARKPAEDFDTLKAAGNTDAYGLWSDGTTMWVTDWGEDKLYAYDLVTKARKPADDVDTLAVAGNTRPRGLWSDGTTMWVTDYYDAKVYAYDLVTGQSQNPQLITFHYDPLGRVTQTTYPDGTQTQACYDDGVTVKIDANQHQTRTTRDASGQVVTVEEYTGTSSTCTTTRGTPYATTRYTYDRLGNLTQITDALGNQTTMTYDTLSRNTQMTDPDRGTWTYQYDGNGNLTQQTDAKQQTLLMQYDALNRRVQKDYGTQKALGQGDVVYTYDGSSGNRQGRLATMQDASGTTGVQYDAMGRVTRTDKTVDSVTYTTQTAYDGLGRVTAVTYPAVAAVTTAVGTRAVTGVTRAATRRATADVDTLKAAGNTEPKGLWADGTTLWVVNWLKAKVYAYDLASQARDATQDVTALQAAQNTRPQGLWSDGTTLWVTNRWDGTIYAYALASGARTTAQDFTGLADAGNRSAAGLWSDGTTLWVTDLDDDKIYAYDLATKARQPSADVETLKAAGNTNPTGLWSDGTTLWVADASDGKLYAYDLATKARQSAQDVETLKAAGNASPQGLWGDGTTWWVTDYHDDKVYAYEGGVTGLTLGAAWTPETGKTYGVRWTGSDGEGELTAIETPGGSTQTVTFIQPLGVEYPAVGDQIEVVEIQRPASEAGTVTYSYTGPRLQRVQEGPTTYATYSGFTALGQPRMLTLGNGATTTYTYDAHTYRLKTVKTVHGSTVLQDLAYTFDSGGKVTKLADTKHGTQTYTYDALDRLTGATNAATGGYGSLTYGYNQIGNMLSHSKVGTYSYNASGASSVRPHAVTKAGSHTYRYDANGNLIRGAGWTITWDEENRPTSITSKDGVTTTLVYDGAGGRVKKSVSTTSAPTTLYIGKLFVCEVSACAKLIYAGHQRLALVQGASGSTSYFHADALGSTSVLTADTGTAEEHNSYRPYGTLHTQTGTSDVAYKFTGQERDASTGLYFYPGRYYEPELGRFLSPEPLGLSPLEPQSLNPYAYGRNNPVRHPEPPGYPWAAPVAAPF